MRSFSQWRKMTWVILLAVVLAVTWVIGSGFSLFIILVTLLALISLCMLWYFTEPLWRQGRGASMRRASPPVIAFKPVRSLVEVRDPNRR
jgi:hypothetical protein